jgi:hypothetical protein
MSDAFRTYSASACNQYLATRAQRHFLDTEDQRSQLMAEIIYRLLTDASYRPAETDAFGFAETRGFTMSAAGHDEGIIVTDNNSGDTAQGNRSITSLLRHMLSAVLDGDEIAYIDPAPDYSLVTVQVPVDHLLIELHLRYCPPRANF